MSESVDRTNNPVTAYLKENGRLEGNVYCLNEQLTNDVSARWELSEEEPVLVSCHAVIDEGIDFYFRYYPDYDVISYNSDTYGTVGDEKTTFSTYGIVDAGTYHEDDEIYVSRITINGDDVAPDQFGGTEALASTVRYYMPLLYGRLKDFGLQDSEQSREVKEARSEAEMVDLLPESDVNTRLKDIVAGETDQNEMDPVEDEAAVIPEELRKDAGSSDLYDAAKNGNTDYLLTLIGEADRIIAVENNSFGKHLNSLLDDMNFYEATEAEQNFLEMIASYGNKGDSSIINEGIKAVYAAGYSSDGSGNRDYKIGDQYVIARCIMVQTESDDWHLFVNQLVGSINTYAQELFSQHEPPQVDGDQFETIVFDGEKPFKFVKLEDSFFSTENAQKAYQFGRLMRTFNEEFVFGRDKSKTTSSSSKYEPGIGMTKQEVLDSSWGKPESVNKTETQYGVHEQWVYGNQRYVYFDDGVVTAIQDHGKDIY